MKLVGALICAALLSACSSSAITPRTSQKTITDYASQCIAISQNYKIPISCDVTKINGILVLQVYYPSVAVWNDWSGPMVKEISAPFCVTANQMQRQAAVQYIVQGQTKDDLAHNLFDCETLETSGWKSLGPQNTQKATTQYQ